ncbi:MAG: methyltransferase [Phycisphaerales bacterium]|nr:methyltransferase [Phycisphaerales bacterium]
MSTPPPPAATAPPTRAAEILAGVNARDVVAGWDDAHRYSPAPRHRRRLVLDWVRPLAFADCLDAGCAQPYLLHEIVRRHRCVGSGCDISDRVMSDNQDDPLGCQFRSLDLTRQRWPGDKRFDLVVCSEVLEHVEDWPAAVRTLAVMTGRHLLITVPSGPVRAMDRMVGHHRHFDGRELAAAVAAAGLAVVRQRKWGFPVHSLYKALISRIAPDKLYDSFATGRYSWPKRLVSDALWLAFFANDPFRGGAQYMLLAERPAAAGEGGRA